MIQYLLHTTYGNHVVMARKGKTGLPIKITLKASGGELSKDDYDLIKKNPNIIAMVEEGRVDFKTSEMGKIFNTKNADLIARRKSYDAEQERLAVNKEAAKDMDASEITAMRVENERMKQSQDELSKQVAALTKQLSGGATVQTPAKSDENQGGNSDDGNQPPVKKPDAK